MLLLIISLCFDTILYCISYYTSKIIAASVIFMDPGGDGVSCNGDSQDPGGKKLLEHLFHQWAL